MMCQYCSRLTFGTVCAACKEEDKCAHGDNEDSGCTNWHACSQCGYIGCAFHACQALNDWEFEP
jgi:hypothetical protein